jgi:chromosome partitioning protein
MSLATSPFESLIINTEHPKSPESLAAAPPMRTIVFSSQKGGSGKTTLCGQLAIQAELAGLGPVALIDTDPQGSLSDWWNARTADTPMFVQTDVECLRDTLEELRATGVKLVFIDTQPTVTNVIREIVSCADLVVIPTRPSPHDLRAVGPTLDLVERCGKPVVFAVNSATRRARITGDVAVALSQHGTVAPVTVHNRTDFATSMVDGRAVMELKPDSPSAKEISALWDYLEVRLNRLERPRNEALFGASSTTPAVIAVPEPARVEPTPQETPASIPERTASACFGRRPVATHAGA